MANWIIDEPEGSQSKSSSFAENPVVRGLGQLGIGGAEGLASLLGLPGTVTNALFGEPALLKRPFFPTSSELTSGVRNIAKKILPESYQNPEGTIESFARKLGSTVPSALLGLASGGSAAPLAASSLGSAGAETVAEEAGFGPGAQAIAGLAGGLGGSAIAGKLRAPALKEGEKPRNAIQRALRSERQQEHNLLQSSVKKGEEGWAPGLKNTLSQVEKELLDTETRKNIADKVEHAIKKVKSNLTFGKISPTKAVALRKSLYKTAKELPEDAAAQYITPITKSMNEFFSDYAAKNPKFYSHLSARNKLYQIENMGSSLRNYISSLKLGELPIVGKIADILGNAGAEGQRFYEAIARNEPARKVYFNLIKEVGKNNTPAVIKGITELSNIMPEVEHQEDNASGWVIE